MQFNTPILFIIFNRPNETQRVFEAIRSIKPTMLYIAADGARPEKPGEKELCDEARKITRLVDWPCEVITNFQEINLGCKIHVSSAITWFFEHVEEGIILEDDCLPDQSFFVFVEEMLNTYRNVNNILMISGNNLHENFVFNTKYTYSRYAHIWGWATWKRAWNKYDVSISSYPKFKNDEMIKKIISNKKIQRYWIKLFDRIYSGKIDTWDAQLQYMLFKENGLSIVPSINLVANIGFGENATHTKNVGDIHANLPTGKISKLLSPATIEPDTTWDNLEEAKLVVGLLRKIINLIKRIV